MQNLYLLILLIFIQNSLAQSVSKVDSLKRVLAKLPKEGSSFEADTTRVEVLCELGEVAKDSSIQFTSLNKAIKLAASINWEKGVANSNNIKGLRLIQNNFNYQAIDALNFGLKIGEKLKEPEIVAYSNKYLGAAYYMLGEFETSIVYYQKAANYYKKRDLRQFCTMQSNIGLSLIKMKKYSEAISKYNLAINLYKSTNDSIPLSWYYSNMGSSQREAGFYKESIISFDKSLAYTPKEPIYEHGFTTSEKAISLMKMGKISEALALSSQAKEWGKEANNFEKAYILENDYLVLKASGDTKNALSAYEDWMNLKNQNDEDMKKKSIEGLKLYYENQQKELSINQEKAKNRNLILGLIALVLGLIIIFRNNFLLNNKNKEIELQKTEISKINTQLEDLNTNLENKVAIRTEELSEANKELIKKNFEITEALYKGQTIERKRVAAELHDNLGSTLSALKWRLGALDSENLNVKEKGIYESIKQMMGNAYEEVRYISHNLLPKEFEEKGLIGAIDKLVNDLNESNNGITFTFKYDSNISFNKTIEIELYSIFMELINNILKHSKATYVLVEISRHNQKNKIEVSNNGIHFDFSNYEKGNGFSNLKYRLSKINGDYLLENRNEIGTKFTINF